MVNEVPSGQDDGPTIFQIVGADFFVRLVDAFYDGVEHDQLLISMYPEGSDTGEARKRLTMFLAQYWGGPHDYMAMRGHPMLRMRHAPFAITHVERDRWLMHMATALEKVLPTVADDVREDVTEEMARYFVNAAEHLRNA